MMAKRMFYATREVARILGVKTDILARAVWLGSVDPPQKSPSGDFLWTERDIEVASWALLHRAYVPESNKDKGETSGS
jgi:hypothetical protein